MRLEPAVAAHLVAGQRSREKRPRHVLRELGLEPLLDLRIRAGEGVGACLAAGLLLSGLQIRQATARTVLDGPRSEAHRRATLIATRCLCADLPFLPSPRGRFRPVWAIMGEWA